MGRILHPVEQDIVAYMPEEDVLVASFVQIGGKFPEPSTGEEEEYEKHVASMIKPRQATIASGEKLLRDPTKLKTLREGTQGRIEVGEMEAVGIMSACRQTGTPWLVVR